MSDLENAVNRIRMYGPDRVVVDAEGLGVSCRRARDEYGVTPDVIFIRVDGWSLGAPDKFEWIADRMWADQWLAVLRRPSMVPVPYVRKPLEQRKFSHERTTGNDRTETHTA